MSRIDISMSSLAPGLITALVGLLFLANFACGKKEPISPEPESPPELSGLLVPEQMFTEGETTYRISVQVEDAQGLSTIDSVTFRIIKVEGEVGVLSGELADDGSDGDMVANDGQYTAILTSEFANGSAGLFRIIINCVDAAGNQSNTLQTSFSLVEGSAGRVPVIMNASAPGSIYNNPDFEFLLSVVVTHPEGLASISRVFYEYSPPANPNPTRSGDLYDDGTHGDQIAGDGVYAVVLSSRLFPKTSPYFIRLLAEDLEGHKSNPLVVQVAGREARESEPLLSALSAPDIVILDTLNSALRFMLAVDDPQGLADINFVRFTVDLPDGSSTAAEMADDGNLALNGDEVAGDGVFSALYELPAIPGEFRFVFQAKDRDDFLSNKIEHFIPVTQLESPVVTNFLAPEVVVIIDNRDTTFAISVDVSDPQGAEDIRSVEYRLLDPSGAQVPGSPFAMLDDGMAESSGDSIAGDGRFSSIVTFDGVTTPGGDFTFIFQARDQKDSLSNELSRTLTVAFNHSPVISNLFAPDSAETHPTQTQQFRLTIDVFDEEGLDDIELVRFRSYLPSVNGQPQQEAQNSPIEMFDDGDFFVNGDQVENDGTYSRIINLPAQSDAAVQEGDFKFVFEAWDKFGQVSNRIEHFINVKNGTGEE